MEVRPIGLLEMMDQGLGDEKVLCVGMGNPRYKDVWNFSEIYPHMLRRSRTFSRSIRISKASAWK